MFSEKAEEGDASEEPDEENLEDDYDELQNTPLASLTRGEALLCAFEMEAGKLVAAIGPQQVFLYVSTIILNSIGLFFFSPSEAV